MDLVKRRTVFEFSPVGELRIIMLSDGTTLATADDIESVAVKAFDLADPSIPTLNVVYDQPEHLLIMFPATPIEFEGKTWNFGWTPPANIFTPGGHTIRLEAKVQMVDEPAPFYMAWEYVIENVLSE